MLEAWLPGEWSHDAATDQVSADAAVFRMYGAAAVSGSVPAAWFSERWHPDDRDRIAQAWACAFQTGASVEVEHRVVWPDGSIHWLSVRTKPGGSGPQRRLYGLSVDITALRQTEAKLSRAANDFRELADAMPQIVWINTPTGAPVFTNQRWQEFSGCDRTETLTDALWTLLHPDDAKDTLAGFKGALENGLPFETERRLWDQQRGAYRWHLVRAVPGFDENGHITRWYGTSTDIDDTKRGQEQVQALNATLERVNLRTAQLFESEQLMKLMVDGIKDFAIFMLDPEGRIAAWNSGAQRLHGYTSEEAIGRHISMFYSPEEVRSGWPQRSIDYALERGQFHDEGLRVRPDGSTIWVSKLITPMRDEAGQLRGFSNIAQDVTEFKRVVEELREAQRRADKANEAKSAFLTSMSHEIRTPLSAILGMAELLWATNLDDEQREYVETFRSAGRNLMTIINDILDLSKIEAGQMNLEAAPFALGSLAKEAVDLFRPQASEKRIRLLLDLSPQAEISLLGDAGRLRQVLVNLLSNAVKFTHSGEVLLTVTRRPSSQDEPVFMEFSVSDTGIGIPTSQLAAIFDDFAQADSSTARQYGGTGLGLGICRRIVAMMGGEINVDSVPGEGSTFSFWLPFQQPSALALATSVGQEAHPFNGRLIHDPPVEPPVLNILIAEDNEKNQKLLIAYLGKTGYALTLVEDGLGAVEKVEQGEFDVVLMDLRMPRMDGLTATRAIRERERRLGLDPLPILALTADAGADESDLSLSAGCNAHLTKPISKGTLLSAIKKHSRKRNAAASSLPSEWRFEAERVSNL